MGLLALEEIPEVTRMERMGRMTRIREEWQEVSIRLIRIDPLASMGKTR
jgi:hypothetical protein